MNFDLSALLVQVILVLIGIYCIRYGIIWFFRRNSIGFVYTALDNIHVAWTLVFGGTLLATTVFWFLGDMTKTRTAFEGSFYLGVCIVLVILTKGIVVLVERHSTVTYALDEWYHIKTEKWSDRAYHFGGYVVIMVFTLLFSLIFVGLATVICIWLGVGVNV